MLGFNLSIFGQKSSGGAGPDPGPSDPYFANVVYLSGFDGADGSTTTVDDSPVGRTMSMGAAGTGGGTSEVDTAVGLFGQNSVYRSHGSSPVIYAADSADWNFADGPFTVEGWFQWESNAGGSRLIQQWGSSSNNWSLRQNSTGQLGLLYSAGGSAVTGWKPLGPPSFTPTLGTWYHIAMCFDGTTYRLFATPLGNTDSTLVGSTTSLSTLPESTTVFAIGGDVGGTLGLQGWLTEVRVTKGVARYTGTFAIPTDKFPRH